MASAAAAVAARAAAAATENNAPTCSFCQHAVVHIPVEVQVFLVAERNAWLRTYDAARGVADASYEFGIDTEHSEAYIDHMESPRERADLLRKLTEKFGATYPSALYTKFVESWAENPEATGIIVRPNCNGNHEFHLACARGAIETKTVPRSDTTGLNIFAKQREFSCPLCKEGDAQIQVPVQVNTSSGPQTQFVPLPSSAVFNEMYNAQDWRTAPIGPYGFRPLDIVLYIPNPREITAAKQEEDRRRDAGEDVDPSMFPLITLHIGRIIDYALTDARSDLNEQWRRTENAQRTLELDPIMKMPPQYVLIQRLGVERALTTEHNLEIVPVDLVFPFQKTPPTQEQIRASSEVLMDAQNANLISDMIRTMYTEKSMSLRKVLENFRETVKLLRERGYLEPDTLNPTNKIHANSRIIPGPDRVLLMDYRQLITYMRSYISATAAEQPLIKEFVQSTYGPDAPSTAMHQIYSEVLGLPNELLASLDITNLSAQQALAKQLVTCGNAIAYMTQLLLNDAGESLNVVPDTSSAVLFLLAGLYDIKLDKRNKLFVYMAEAFDRLPSCTTQGAAQALRKPDLLLAYNPETRTATPNVVLSLAHLEALPQIAQSDFLGIARTLPAFVEPIRIDKETDEQATLMIRCAKRLFKMLVELGMVGQNGFMNILAYFWAMWKRHGPLSVGTSVVTEPFIPQDVFDITEAKKQPETTIFAMLDRGLRTHCFDSLDSRTIALATDIRSTMRNKVASGARQAYPTLRDVRNSEAFNNFVNAYAIQIAVVFAEPQALLTGSVTTPAVDTATQKHFGTLRVAPVPPTLTAHEAAQLTPLAGESGSRVQTAGQLLAVKTDEAARAAAAQTSSSLREEFLFDLSRTLQERASRIAEAGGIHTGLAAPVSVPVPALGRAIGPAPTTMTTTVAATTAPRPTQPPRRAAATAAAARVAAAATSAPGPGAITTTTTTTTPPVPQHVPQPPPPTTSNLLGKRERPRLEETPMDSAVVKRERRTVETAMAPAAAAAAAATISPQERNIRERTRELTEADPASAASIPDGLLLAVVAQTYQYPPFAQYVQMPLADIGDDTVADYLLTLAPMMASIVAAMATGDVGQWDPRRLAITDLRDGTDNLYLQYFIYLTSQLRADRGLDMPTADAADGRIHANLVPQPPLANIADAAYNNAVAIAAQRRFLDHARAPVTSISDEALDHIVDASLAELGQLFPRHPK